MMIPLINPQRRNPIVFKSGQEGVMSAFKKYARQRLKSGMKTKRLLHLHKTGQIAIPKFSSNPRRPPKEWFYKKVAEFTRKGYKDPARMVGFLWYHQASKKRKKEILSHENPFRQSLMTTKRPAVRTLRQAQRVGGLFTKGRTRRSSPTEEGSMVYSLKPRRHRRKHARRARHNPYRDVGLLSRLTGGTRRKRRGHRRSRRIRLGAHRPIVIRAAHSWRRPKRSRLFRRATRINPRRHRRHARRHSYRRNPLGLPKLPFQLQNVVMGGLKLAGGIAIGAYMFPLLAMVIPKNKEGTAPMVAEKYWGAAHVILGAVVAATMKKEVIRTMALTVAGVGVYDLIASNIPQLGLAPVRALSLPGFKASGDEPGVIGMEADMEPAMLGSSYQTALGASYGRDDIAYGGDNDSLDC